MIGLHPQPKPRTRRQVKAKKDRSEDKTKRIVRALCVERDGDCRLGDWEQNPDDWHSDSLEGDACEGPSQWCHMKHKSRAKTRGQSPQIRHTTADSFMACQKHHAQYDGRQTPRLFIFAFTDLGADAMLSFARTTDKPEVSE